MRGRGASALSAPLRCAARRCCSAALAGHCACPRDASTNHTHGGNMHRARCSSAYCTTGAQRCGVLGGDGLAPCSVCALCSLHLLRLAHRAFRVRALIESDSHHIAPRSPLLQQGTVTRCSAPPSVPQCSDVASQVHRGQTAHTTASTETSASETSDSAHDARQRATHASGRNDSGGHEPSCSESDGQSFQHANRTQGTEKQCRRDDTTRTAKRRPEHAHRRRPHSTTTAALTRQPRLLTP